MGFGGRGCGSGDFFAAKTGVLCVFFNPVVETTDYYIGHPYGFFYRIIFWSYMAYLVKKLIIKRLRVLAVGGVGIVAFLRPKRG